MAAPVDSGLVRTTDPKKPRSNTGIAFRDIIPTPDHPRIAGIENHTALSWCESRRQIEAPAWLINRLDAKNIEKPFVGFTIDGVVQDGVYEYSEDEGAPTATVAEKVAALFKLLSDTQKDEVHCGEVDDDEFRLWSNPELYVNPGGLRLDETSPEVQNAVHEILKASTSPEGYDKILGCCLTNHFLGQLVNGRRVLNQHSYNFRLFGVPSTSSPWGYTFFGHHLCLSVVFLQKCMVIGPTFMGAEPDWIDEGPHTGLRLFQSEELESLRLMQGLPAELQDRATISKGMDGKSLGADRWNPFDERHLGGARQDNRVVPYEGVRVTCLPASAQESIIKIFVAFNEYYPTPVLAHRIELFKKHLYETYFAWIGEFSDDDPYYYRIHSPVAWMELDFHCGIFLTNTTPARCHIHTINRLPNRGDYARALLARRVGT